MARLLLVPEDREVPINPLQAIDAVASRSPRNARALAQLAEMLAALHTEDQLREIVA